MSEISGENISSGGLPSQVLLRKHCEALLPQRKLPGGLVEWQAPLDAGQVRASLDTTTFKDMLLDPQERFFPHTDKKWGDTPPFSPGSGAILGGVSFGAHSRYNRRTPTGSAEQPPKFDWEGHLQITFWYDLGYRRAGERMQVRGGHAQPGMPVVESKIVLPRPREVGDGLDLFFWDLRRRPAGSEVEVGIFIGAVRLLRGVTVSQPL